MDNAKDPAGNTIGLLNISAQNSLNSIETAKKIVTWNINGARPLGNPTHWLTERA